MQKQIADVQTFHEVYGLPVATTPAVPNSRTQQLRLRLLREEVDELEEAFENNDLVEAADALTDIAYILFGGVIECGLQNRFEALFAEVQRSNMSKLDAEGKPIEKRRTHYTYDTKGWIIKWQVTDGNGKAVGSAGHTYDEHGNRMETVDIDGEGQPVRLRRYVYEFWD